jgi:hypothetical protein
LSPKPKYKITSRAQLARGLFLSVSRVRAILGIFRGSVSRVRVSSYFNLGAANTTNYEHCDYEHESETIDVFHRVSPFGFWFGGLINEGKSKAWKSKRQTPIPLFPLLFCLFVTPVTGNGLGSIIYPPLQLHREYVNQSVFGVLSCSGQQSLAAHAYSKTCRVSWTGINQPLSGRNELEEC